MEKSYVKQKLYNVDEVKQVLSLVTGEDYLTIYTAKDVQRIFSLESLSSARRLMNRPGFPAMRVGRALRVTRGNLIEYIKQNERSKIFF